MSVWSLTRTASTVAGATDAGVWQVSRLRPFTPAQTRTTARHTAVPPRGRRASLIGALGDQLAVSRSGILNGAVMLDAN